MSTMEVNQVIFRDDLYPRIEPSPATVQKYAEDLDVLPAIEVNQNNELIDGWHRWTAHKKKDAESIKVIVTETKNDAHLLELAIERNAKHGHQLSGNPPYEVWEVDTTTSQCKQLDQLEYTPATRKSEMNRYWRDVLGICQ